jgi:signal transducing adaptor molecule
MFGGAANPYDEIIGQFQLALPCVYVKPELTSLVKATDENLASEDWALNIEVCDKVTGDGANG